MYISDRQELVRGQGNQMPLCPNNGFCFTTNVQSMSHASCQPVAPGKRKDEIREIRTRLVTNGVFQQQMTHDYNQLDIVYR